MCTGRRTLLHNQIFPDGWFTKFSYPWSSAGACFARGSSAIIPSTDVIQLTLNLKMTNAQVIETSVTVDNNSPIQDNLQCMRILDGRNLVRVRNIVVVAIFVSSSLREASTWRFREQIASSKKTPALQAILRTIGCFHMTSRRPYWCPKTMKRRLCWCPKPILRELNSFLMQMLSFVSINLHRCWPRE